MNIQTALNNVIAGKDLSHANMHSIMQTIMQGDATPAQIGGLLVALRLKGESIDEITAAAIVDWQPGETLLLTGTMLTGRDAAHKRLLSLLSSGQSLPEGVDFDNKFIYYVGPVDPVRDEVIGPAGPTTATRMDKFTDELLEKTGITLEKEIKILE